jgi:hypothetical protein
VRTYFRIISVAIMLLKSFALGATESDITESLSLMDRTVEALRTCIVDDVHVASRFADLLDTLSSNLKPRLIRISADGRSGRSRRVTPHGGPDPSSTRGDKNNPQASQNVADATRSQDQWNYNNSNNMTPLTGTMGNTNSLFGVSNETYDLMGNDNVYSVMPPPGFSNSSPNGTMYGDNANGSHDSYNQNGQFGGDNQQLQDWLTLPLDPLLNMSGADVDQTMYGPQLGGHDMLEYLLNSDPTPNHGFQ